MKEKPLGRFVITDELYTLLKGKILSHSMTAGDKINIDKLARDLGVSNIPIRESLFRLVSDGFVTVVPFKGMYVAEMNLTDIDEIFEIRRNLEELSIRKATPNIPDAQLIALLEKLTQNEKPVDSDEESAISMNHDLHGIILKYANNENLKQMVTSIIDRIHRYLNLFHYKLEMGAEIAEHEMIVRALLERDTGKAVEAMDIHLQNARRRLRENFI
jgi:DNA-binding GntR family transcriptional regulator